MIEPLLIALGLGLAGLDPAGALIAAGALGGGARKRYVLAFGVVSLIGIAAFGTALSLSIGPRISSIDWDLLVPAESTTALVEAGLGGGLLIWGAVRTRRPGARAPKPRSARGTGPVILLAVALLTIPAAILDPAFVALTAMAARFEGIPSTILAHLTWVLVSQAPLVLVLFALAGGKHEGAVVWLRSLWVKTRRVAGYLVTTAMLLAGLFLVLDAGWWFSTVRFLVPV